MRDNLKMFDKIFVEINLQLWRKMAKIPLYIYNDLHNVLVINNREKILILRILKIHYI